MQIKAVHWNNMYVMPHRICRTTPLRSLAMSLAGLMVMPGLFARGQAADGSAAPPSRVQQEMDLGVKAYNSRQYEAAVAHFQAASSLDPRFIDAKAYQATALGQIVIPLLEKPENVALARRVIALFRQVLAVEPRNVIARKGLAKAYFDCNALENARTWALSTLDLDPADPYAAYVVGVADWTEANQNVTSTFDGSGWHDDGVGNAAAPVDLLETIRVENADLVAEALKYLKLAVEERPDYEDAMLYLGRTLQRKADLEYGNPTDARVTDLREERQWLDRAMRVRNAKTRAWQLLGPGSMPNLRSCVILRNMMAPTRCVPFGSPKSTSPEQPQP